MSLNTFKYLGICMISFSFQMKSSWRQTSLRRQYPITNRRKRIPWSGTSGTGSSRISSVVARQVSIHSKLTIQATTLITALSQFQVIKIGRLPICQEAERFRLHAVSNQNPENASTHQDRKMPTWQDASRRWSFPIGLCFGHCPRSWAWCWSSPSSSVPSPDPETADPTPTKTGKNNLSKVYHCYIVTNHFRNSRQSADYSEDTGYVYRASATPEYPTAPPYNPDYPPHQNPYVTTESYPTGVIPPNADYRQPLIQPPSYHDVINRPR